MKALAVAVLVQAWVSILFPLAMISFQFTCFGDFLCYCTYCMHFSLRNELLRLVLSSGFSFVSSQVIELFVSACIICVTDLCICFSHVTETSAYVSA